MARNHSVREAANIMGCSITNVLTLLWRADRLPGAVKIDGKWAIPDSALRRYIRQREARRGQRLTASPVGRESECVSDSAVSVNV